VHWVIVEPRRTARGDSPRAGRDRIASSAVTRFFHPAPFDAYEDPRAAPGAYKGPSAADPWTLRRGWQNLLWAHLCGLVFLIFPAVSLVADQPSRTLLILQGTAVAAIAVA
jgi:hypothetical protein